MSLLLRVNQSLPNALFVRPGLSSREALMILRSLGTFDIAGAAVLQHSLGLLAERKAQKQAKTTTARVLATSSRNRQRSHADSPFFMPAAGLNHDRVDSRR